MTPLLVVWHGAMLRRSVITKSRYNVPGARFPANLTGTSLGTVHGITQASHFRFTSKSPIPASSQKGLFYCGEFELDVP